MFVCVCIYLFLFTPCLFTFTALQTNNSTHNLTLGAPANRTFHCTTRADCSIEDVAEDSRFIQCLGGTCWCDDTCFDRTGERCQIKKCYKYSFGEDSCQFEGRNWRITSVLAKYAGFVGGVYFYLGRWELGAIQLSVFAAIVITLPVIICIYCMVGCVMLRIGVKLRELYGIVKRVVVSIVCICCVQCVCVGVCVAWYVVITVLVAHNLLKDAEGCGMGNEPEFIHIV